MRFRKSFEKRIIVHCDVITLSLLTLACAYNTIALISYFLATSMQEITKQKRVMDDGLFFTLGRTLSTQTCEMFSVTLIIQ